MGAREMVRGLIIDDATVLDDIPAVSWVSSGSLTEDNAPARPFAVIRWGVVQVGMADVKRATVTFWIHDEPGTYERIDRVLNRLYAILNGVAQVSDGSGDELISIEWDSSSGDLYDPGYRTITKTTTFNIVGKGI